ncbi:calmodulin-like protein 2 [Gastrolobium bilobum]|uniref:calmodulin-like protein 2 n=1 Tax=Gastrolobium bilobum TaxID=150636 RepID=UPI002AB14C97|nr:calmodulin-like protein 2 [Gastrolobium bilobum]
MGMTKACSRFIVDFLQAFKYSPPSSMPHLEHNPHPICEPKNMLKLDDKMVRALVTVFGMETNGRIKKESARHVVEKLGLMHCSEKDKPSVFELHGEGGLQEDEVPVEEMLGELEDMSKRSELLREAFKIFDEDGDGYIDAMELKRVLDCLGLGKGWDMSTIEKMVKVVDLNFDGKVDFGEFELMMG